MIKQNIFKTIGFLTLSVFAVGILFLSARANQVEAKGAASNSHQMMMQKHHGDNWQDHHQQMHGSDDKL